MKTVSAGYQAMLCCDQPHDQPHGLHTGCLLIPYDAGTSSKRAAAAVENVAAGGVSGFSWRQRGTESFEADVSTHTPAW
jgi:hypothetical protein